MIIFVRIDRTTFKPPNITINVNDVITWLNEDINNGGHMIVSDTGLFNSPLLDFMNGYSYKFSTAGMFPYHCKINPSLKGVIYVH
jgi:plastocyanin